MGRKTNHVKRYENSGRPTKMTDEVITKLEEAFMKSFTDKEACFSAGISTMALFRYEEKNPEFRERKKMLKNSPNMAAKTELAKSIKGNLNQARWWATNKMNEEFGPRPTTAVQINNETITNVTEVTPEVKEAIFLFEDEMRKVLTKRPDQPQIEEAEIIE